MTLYEVDLLTVRHRQVEARADRRAALAAWVLANVHRDSERDPDGMSLETVVAWLGHNFQPQEQVPAPPERTPEDILTQAQVLTELFGTGAPLNGTMDQ
jgi:hypothetical protein